MHKAPLLLFLVILVAGCTGAAPTVAPPGPTSSLAVPTAQPAEITETTGAIDGFVHDDELVALTNVLVQDAGHGLNTTTDAEGHFTFSHLEPGTYQLFAARLGYDSAARNVAIEAGQISHVEFSLPALAVQEAYHRTYHQKGLLGCAVVVSVPVVGPGGLSACGSAAIVTLLTGQDTSSIDKFALYWKIPEHPASWNASILEMAWRSSQALGNGLGIYWEVNQWSGDGALTFGTGVGKSPVTLRADEKRLSDIVNHSSKPSNCKAQGLLNVDTSKECNPDHCNMQTRVFSAAQATGQAVDVGVALQQSFEQWITNFYYGAPADGYTALSDT